MASPSYKLEKFRRMNLDSDIRGLKQGEYRRLINGIPIQPQSSSTGTLSETITNLFGQALVANADLAGGTNKIIGGLEDRAGNRYIFFVYNSGGSHTIYQYSGGVITRVLRTSLFGFSATDFVDCDIIGEFLVFTNNVSEIKCINVTRAIASGYTPTVEEITLIKKNPIRPLTLAGVAIGGQTFNNVAYNTFSFYYRYIYVDNDYSVWSSFSETALFGYATGSIDVTIPAAEVIPATVVKAEFAFRINGGNEIVIYKSVTGPAAGTTHRFYNDTNLQTIPDSESFKLNDSAPNTSKAIKIIENKVFLFGNTEGYNLTGAPITGATLALQNVATSNLEEHVFKDDSIYGVGIAFFDNYNRLIGSRKISDIDIPKRAIATPTGKMIRVDLSGIAQADIPTTAISYSVVRTKNKRTTFFISGVTADIFYRKIKSDGTSLYLKAIGVLPTRANFDDLLIDLSSLTAISMGYTFNPGDRVKLILNTIAYDFVITGQEGKFLVVNARGLNETLGVAAPTHTLFEIYTPKANDVEIFYETGNKYVISNPGGGSRAFSTTTVDLKGDAYFANRYVNAVAPVTYFSYDTAGYSPTDPFANVPKDILVTTVSGAGGPADVFYSMSFTSNNGGALNKNYNIWVDQDGKSIPFNYNGFVQKVKSNIRFSQVYNNESQILGLNTFQALDDQKLGIENGAATGLAVAGKVLVAIQEVESSAVYIGEGYVNTSDGNKFLAKTESVIGDTQKYLGRKGSVHQATIVSRDSVVYWLDARNGVVIRRSQDGLTVISEYGIEGGGIQQLVSTLCITHAALGANSRIVGGWDPQYQCYVLSFVNTSNGAGVSLYWHEKTKSWVCQTQLNPEFLGQLGLYQLVFSSGTLWLQTVEANYNKFINVQYTRTLEWEIGNDSLEKIWEAIEVDAEAIYATAGANEIVVSLYHVRSGTLQNRINYLDFKLRGSAWRSSFFRNLNDEYFSGDATASKYKSAHNTRGQSAFLSISYNGTDRNQMKSISVFFRPSLNTSP